MNIKVKISLIILITFISGLLSGALIQRMFLQKKVRDIVVMREPGRMNHWITRIIRPRPRQAQRVQTILDKYDRQNFRFRRNLRTQQRQTLEAMRNELGAILNREQMRRLDRKFFTPRRTFPGPRNRQLQPKGPGNQRRR